MKEIYLSTISSMVKVLRDKPLTAFPELKGSALKNEGYTFQVVAKPEEEINGCSIKFGGKLSKYCKAYPITDMPSEQSLDKNCDDYVLKSSDDFYPELCEEENEFSLKAKEYKGTYHILYGVLSAVNGVGPSDLNIDSLIKRVEEGNVSEVIIATNPNVEGETTALFLAELLSKLGVSVTRLAYGLPVGGNLDYADEFTLLKAIEGRRKIK